MATINKNNPPSYQHPRYDIISHISDSNRILDIGCNNGATGKALKEKYPKASITGIDYNEEALDIAKSYIDDVFQCNLDDVSKFKDIISKQEKYDVIIMADVLEHIRFPKLLVESAVRKLSDDGYIIVSIPNTGFYSSFIHLLRRKWPRNERGIYDKTHIQFFLKNNIDELRPKGYTLKVIDLNLRIKEIGRTRFDKFILPIIRKISYVRDFFIFQYILRIEKER